MSESIKTPKVTPASRSVAANAGQSAVSLPAVPVLQSREVTQFPTDPANGNFVSRNLPEPFQLRENTAGAPLKKSSISNTVLQRVFNSASVEDAIMGADRSMHDMGGTTGGAFHLITNAEDPDVRELVLKASGKTSAVLASNIYNMVGIPAPKALMLPVSEPLINHLGTLTSGAAEKFGSQASIEVQQHTNVVPLPDSLSGQSPAEGKAAVLAGDTLTGNHDRIHSHNAENFSGAFAIDNVVKDDTTQSKEMMAIAKQIIKESSVVHKQTLKVYQLLQHTSSGRIGALKVQKAFLLELQRIGERAEDILMLIDEANQQEDENSKSVVVRLTLMDESDSPIQGEPLEMVIAEIGKSSGSSRKSIIRSNLRSRTAEIGKDRYEPLKARLAQIRRWHEDGEIAEAVVLIELTIQEIGEKYKEEKGNWDVERSKAEAAAKKKWEDLNFFSQLFSNKEKFIRDILNGWEADNPRPE